MARWKNTMSEDEWLARYENIAKKNSIANKGQIPWSKGKKLTEEHKMKISISEKRTKSENKLKLMERNDVQVVER